MTFEIKQAARQPKRVTARQLEALPPLQGFACPYTGIEITPTRSSLDHKNPRALGGEDDFLNLQIVLPVINRAKGVMSHSQFVAMCHAVARHVADSGDVTWIDGELDG